MVSDVAGFRIAPFEEAVVYVPTSSAMSGTSLIAPERVIQRWHVPGLSYDDVERRSRKYMAQINVHELTPDLIARLRTGVPLSFAVAHPHYAGSVTLAPGQREALLADFG